MGTAGQFMSCDTRSLDSSSTEPPYAEVRKGNTTEYTTTCNVTRGTVQELAQRLEAECPSINSRHHAGPHYELHNELTSNESDQTKVPDKKFMSKVSCKHVISVIIVVIFAGLLIFLFKTVFYLLSMCKLLETKVNSLERTLGAMHEEPYMCLPCYELTQGPFEEDNPELEKLLHLKKNGHSVCCAKTSLQMSILLNLFVKRKQLEVCAHELVADNGTSVHCNTTTVTPGGPPPPHSPPQAVSAHLLIGKQPENLTNEQPIRKWLYGRPGTHLRGIRADINTTGRFFVPETGIYFIYSQVGFLVYYNQDEVPDADGGQTLSHSVNRFNVIYPLGNEQLMQSRLTQCWERQKDYGRYTSYVGAAVELNKGDQIYVNVSKIQFLSREETWGYFGMFKLR